MIYELITIEIEDDDEEKVEIQPFSPPQQLQPQEEEVNEVSSTVIDYEKTLGEIVKLLEVARCTASRSVNAIMTATYWDIGRRIVEHEQGGQKRAEYGTALLEQLSVDLTAKFGNGFSLGNLRRMRTFYLKWSIRSTVSIELTKQQELFNKTDLYNATNRFPLPWSHYVCLLSVKSFDARAFYEKEALRGGWSQRELKRQIDTLTYERTVRSKSKELILTKGAKHLPEDTFLVEEELKDPYILEFLDLEDGHSEKDLEEALISKLQSFLLELGSEFAFVGRQKRLRVGGNWYKIDLLFFHRVLRCLIIIDLKIGDLTHADVGQMNMYINYATEHWMYPEENYPVGLILCSKKDKELAHYATGNLNNIIAIEHKIKLNRQTLIAEIEQARRSYPQ